VARDLGGRLARRPSTQVPRYARDDNAALFPNCAVGLGGARFAAFDHGQLGAADAEGPANFPFDFGAEVGVLLDEQFGVFASLAEAHVAVGEPGAGLLDDLVLDTDVDELAGLGDPLAVADVELRLAERRGALVLDHLDFDARADDFFPFLDLVGAADVEAHRGVELESPAAGGGLRIAEHHPDLL